MSLRSLFSPNSYTVHSSKNITNDVQIGDQLNSLQIVNDLESPETLTTSQIYNAVTGGGGSGNLSGSLTNHYVPVATGEHELEDSIILQNSNTVGIAGNLTVNGGFRNNLSSSDTFRALGPGSSYGVIMYGDNPVYNYTAMDTSYLGLPDDDFPTVFSVGGAGSQLDKYAVKTLYNTIDDGVDGAATFAGSLEASGNFLNDGRNVLNINSEAGVAKMQQYYDGQSFFLNNNYDPITNTKQNPLVGALNITSWTGDTENPPDLGFALSTTPEADPTFRLYLQPHSLWPVVNNDIDLGKSLYRYRNTYTVSLFSTDIYNLGALSTNNLDVGSSILYNSNNSSAGGAYTTMESLTMYEFVSNNPSGIAASTAINVPFPSGKSYTDIRKLECVAVITSGTYEGTWTNNTSVPLSGSVCFTIRANDSFIYIQTESTWAVTSDPVNFYLWISTI